jgi:hypothetical protein
VGADEIALLLGSPYQRGFLFRADSWGEALSSSKVDVHELIAWDLDEYPYRNFSVGHQRDGFTKQIEWAQQKLAERECHASCPALLAEESKNVDHLFAECRQRSDLQAEYEGLAWTLGVVDLHRLLAFQRRLVFSPGRHTSPTPQQDDWPQLISFTVGLQRDTEHHVVRNRSATGELDISLHSSNPDLQLRLSPDAGGGRHLPLSLYGGSPFLEVAELRGRWFLRDGYHRAYRLLQAGVHRIPAVVIYTRTIGELGATKPWFFSEGQLFSDRPPHVMDFLDENLVLRYARTAFRKVIRIRVEESLQVFDETDEVQGEEI